MMNQQICDPNRLSSFVRGELSDQAERELTSHLDECESCGQALEQQVAEASAWREASVFLGEPVAQAHEAEFSATQSRDAQIDQVLSQLSPTDDPDSLGRIGGYEVTGAIGSGGMGVVLKARDQSLDRVVAVKVMAPHLAASGSARQRFAREAKAAAAVLHPNVIAIHGVSNEQALPYLVMPYVRGQSLQKRIDAEGPLPLVDIMRIAAQVAAGLAAAHDQGLVHRDIKPGNILMEQGVERVTITDFGLARAVDDASMTCSGVIAGTPQYMSPEQARAEKIDHRSDLFSLGSVLYAMCTGHPPFRAESSFSVLRLITDKHPRPIRETNPDIPDWLCAIIQKLMAKDADDRFDSAKEVAELLEKCVAHVQQPLQFELPMIPEDHTSGVVTTDLSQWAKCVFSSPDHQRSFFGRHVWPFLERGKVRLNNDSIEWTYNSGLHQKIPFLCIKEVSIGHYSRLTHPMRMDFLSIRYRDGDTVRTQLLTPLSSILTPVTTANAAVRRYADRLPQSVAEPNSSGSKRGWSSKFLATCFLPILLLAGVLIVLQWNKGTLRIESEADDVPIRVVQGKDVVEELTVSKSGKSVRIAAGNYKIEIGGQIDGLALDDDSVTLQRGGNDVVRIVKVAPVASALGDWPYGRLRKNLQEIKPPGGAPVIPSGDPISVAMGAELTRRLEAVPDGELDKWLVELERVTGDKLNGEMARQACRTYIVNRMSVLFEDSDWNTNTASRLFKQLQSLNPSEVEAWKNAFESLMKETIGQNDREVFDGGPSYAVPLVLISVDALFDDAIEELSSRTTDLSLASGMTESSIAQDLAIKYRKRISQLAKQDITLWRSKVDRFGGTKLDAAMNIILLDAYFVDEKFQDGDFAATLGGTNPKDSAGQVTDSAGGTDAPSANQSSVSPRRETVNNLTHIINALHHYHEVHGHLPPGTISGKDGRGGPPHSWRVELLPLLGHQELYDQYHFDEPWNSEHNKRLLAKIPDVYRSPLDKAESTYTSYFGVVSDDISKRAAQLQEMRDQRVGGPNDVDESAYIGDDDPATLQAHYEQYTPEATVFWKQRGASFIDMLDGTSNCIAVIEAKRDVPWTKPDDIEYSADQPLPKFGGWFEQGVHAAFADGTVKFLANDNDEQTMRNLLTISDGQPVEPLLVRQLRIHGAVEIPEDEPEVALGPETYQVPGGPLLMIQSDKKSVLTEADIMEVTATTDPNNPSGGDIVTMTLTEEAGERFLEATTKLSEQGTSGYMVITFDRKVLSAPRVLTPIGNKLTITGNIDAKALAEQIQAAMDEVDAPKKPDSAEAELEGVEPVQAVPQEEGEYVTVPLKVEWHSATAMEQILGQRHLTILADGVMKDDDHSNAVNRVLRSVLHDCRLDSYKLVARDESDYWDARLFVPRKPEYAIGALWYSDPIRTLRIGDRHTPVPAPTLTQDDPQAKLDEELKNGFHLRLDDSTEGEPALSFERESGDRGSPDNNDGKVHVYLYVPGSRSAELDRLVSPLRSLVGDRALIIVNSVSGDRLSATIHPPGEHDAEFVQEIANFLKAQAGFPFEEVKVNLNRDSSDGGVDESTLLQPESFEEDSKDNNAGQRPNARRVVEAYIAAALKGDLEQAATLAKGSTGDRKTIAEIPKFLNIQRLKIVTVYVNDPAKPTRAMATSEAVKLDEEHEQPDGQRDGFVVVTLKLFDDAWRVTDIDFETPAGAEQELKRFLEANPKSIGLPPDIHKRSDAAAANNNEYANLAGQPKDEGDAFSKLAAMPGWIIAWDSQMPSDQVSSGRRLALLRAFADGRIVAVHGADAELVQTQIAPVEIEQLVANLAATGTSRNRAVAVQGPDIVAKTERARRSSPESDDPLPRVLRAQIGNRVTVVHEDSHYDLMSFQATGPHVPQTMRRHEVTELSDEVRQRLMQLVYRARLGGFEECIAFANAQLRARYPDTPVELKASNITQVYSPRDESIEVIFRFGVYGKPVSFPGGILKVRYESDGTWSVVRGMYFRDEATTERWSANAKTHTSQSSSDSGRINEPLIAGRWVDEDGNPIRGALAELYLNDIHVDDASAMANDSKLEAKQFESRITGQHGFLTTKQAVSLDEAVAAFNGLAGHSEVGRKQPKLTADEVVASIRNWIDRNKGNAATRKELQQIIDTQTLRAGHQLSFTSRYVSEGHVFDVWEIGFGDDDSVPWLRIRDVLLASRPKTQLERELWEQIRTEMAESFDHVRLGGLDASSERSPEKQTRLGKLLDQAYQPRVVIPGTPSAADEAALHKFRPYRATRRTQVKDKIHKMLQQPTLKSIRKLPLAEVAEQFARFHDVKIDIDPLWLEDETPDLNQPVSADLGDLSLGAALDFILEPLGMSYIVRDDEIRITSIDRADAYQYERVHELPPPLKGQEEQVIQALTTKITPGKWWLSGGEYVASANEGWLTISANRTVHEAATMLLKEFQQANRPQSTQDQSPDSTQTDSEKTPEKLNN